MGRNAALNPGTEALFMTAERMFLLENTGPRRKYVYLRRGSTIRL
jgi:hypothetical protein